VKKKQRLRDSKTKAPTHLVENGIVTNIRVRDGKGTGLEDDQHEKTGARGKIGSEVGRSWATQLQREEFRL
jgi:hypothetical protein